MARWMDRQRNSNTYRQTRLGIRQTYNWERTSFSIKETRKSYLLKTGCVRKSLVLLNIVFSILSLGSGPKSSAIFSCKTRTPSRSQKKDWQQSSCTYNNQSNTNKYFHFPKWRIQTPMSKENQTFEPHSLLPYSKPCHCHSYHTNISSAHKKLPDPIIIILENLWRAEVIINFENLWKAKKTADG